MLVSCKEDFEISKFACYLASIYGPKLTMNTGYNHDYLGIDLEFKGKKCEVSMFAYLNKTIAEFPDEISGWAPSQAADHLFQIRDETEVKYWLEEQAIRFHHTTAQLLFMSTRAWRDIQMAVSFCTSRVKKPDKDNWGKLK